MTNDENPTVRQYSNLDVFGKIKQKIAQGKESDDVVLVSTLAPLSSTPATSSGSTPDYVVGQTAIVNGVVYICSAIGGQEGAWTYTWTTAGDPSYANVIETVKAQGTPLTVTDKAVDVTRSSLGLYDKSISINGSSYALESTANTNLPTIYAPTTLGTTGQFIKGNSSGAPQWQTYYNNKLSINGSATTVMATGSTSLSIYAPTSAGSTAGSVPRWPSSGNIPVWESVDTSVTQNSSHLITSGAVYSYVQSLPDPMVFKGTVGTSGTVAWADLPQPETGTGVSSGNEGWTYKVITKYTNTGSSDYRPSAEVGDTIISNGTAWIVIPSGDVPVGTVTSVATGVGLTGGPITSSGTIKANLNSETSIGTIGANKVYAVGVASNHKLAVAVPWTDTEVTQNYTNGAGEYPLLFSAVAGHSSTDSRGTTTTLLCNGIYAIPNSDTVCAAGIMGSRSDTTDGLGLFSGYASNAGSSQIVLRRDGKITALINDAYNNAMNITFSTAGVTFVPYAASNGFTYDGATGIVSSTYLKPRTSGTIDNVSTTNKYAVTGSAVNNALQNYSKKASYTISVQTAGAYVIPSSTSPASSPTTAIGFTPKLVQIYDPDGIQVLVRTEIDSTNNKVTFRTATTLSAAQTWTVNIIGW